MENEITKQIGEGLRGCERSKVSRKKHLQRSTVSLEVHPKKIEGKQPPNLGIVKIQELANGFRN